MGGYYEIIPHLSERLVKERLVFIFFPLLLSQTLYHPYCLNIYPIYAIIGSI